MPERYRDVLRRIIKLPVSNLKTVLKTGKRELLFNNNY